MFGSQRWAWPVISVLRGLRQDCEVHASLDYRDRSSLQKQNRQKDIRVQAQNSLEGPDVLWPSINSSDSGKLGRRFGGGVVGGTTYLTVCDNSLVTAVSPVCSFKCREPALALAYFFLLF